MSGLCVLILIPSFQVGRVWDRFKHGECRAEHRGIVVLFCDGINLILMDEARHLLRCYIPCCMLGQRDSYDVVFVLGYLVIFLST